MFGYRGFVSGSGGDWHEWQLSVDIQSRLFAAMRAGGVQAIVPTPNGQLTVTLPPISALMLSPVLTGGPLTGHVSGHQITLSWATNYLGWTLQSNAVSLLAGTSWFPVPGSPATNRLTLNLAPGETNVFYRLIAP